MVIENFSNLLFKELLKKQQLCTEKASSLIGSDTISGTENCQNVVSLRGKVSRCRDTFDCIMTSVMQTNITNLDPYLLMGKSKIKLH